MTDLREFEGRQAFGADPRGYDEVRPAYPDWMFTTLRQQHALLPTTSTLEVGAGTGLATRELIRHGAAPLTIVEPDRRFAPFLDPLTDHRGEACTVIHQPFEQADISNSPFELIVLATAYHWLDPATRVDALAALLKPGGTLALLWHVFQNPNLSDPFHDATAALLSQLPSSPSGAPDTLPFALDHNARKAELTGSNRFVLSCHQSQYWTLTLNSAQIRSLYAGFSGLSRLPADQKSRLLDQLQEVTEKTFNGTVARNMTSVLYLFTRRD